MFTSCTAPLVTRINVGMLPCRSSKVCIVTAALPWRNFAHGNSDKHRSMVVESRAVLRLLYTIAAVPKPGGSILYGDGLEDFGDGLFQDLGSASFGGAEQLLQLRPGLLDRIEIG